MNTPPNIIQPYLRRLGLTPYATKLYEVLLARGELSISDLARYSHIERTRVYRVLPELESTGLIEITREEREVLVSAAELSNVQILLSKKEQEVADLARLLPTFQSAVAYSLSPVANRTIVKTYRGSDGIKQMLWNETKAKGELLSILRHGIQLKTKKAFFERWVERCNQQGLHARGVVSEEFTDSLAMWHTKHVTDKLRYWQGRVVSSGAFSIEQNMIIYDDVVGFFNWGEDEVYGVEIHNPLIANTQRQFFELLWSSSDELLRIQ